MKFHPQSNERINFFILHIHRTTSSEKEESFLKGNAWERAVKLGEYITESKNTVRQTAAKFGISKSTVHTVVTKWNGERDHMKKEMISQKIRFNLFADELS